jgi:signal transduction histidine kinase
VGPCTPARDDAAYVVADPRRRPDVFAGGLAHELRTPLAIVKGRLHALQDGVIDPASGECEKLLVQIDRLMRIVDDLGTLAKAQAGEMTLDLRFVELAQIVGHLKRVVGPEAEASHVALVICSDAGTIHCDLVRFAQALTMLLRSALESIGARRAVGRSKRAPVELSLTIQVSVAPLATGVSPIDDPWEIGLRPALALALIAAHGGKVTVDREGLGDEDMQILVALPAF